MVVELMQALLPILPYIQIGLAILLVALILLQQTSSTLGGAFGGGDNWSASFHTRRGAEKVIFNGTIVIAILFVAISLVRLVTAY